MSALTLLSVFAPPVPSVPQGSSGEAASGFQSLLAALSGEDAAAPGTGSDAEAAAVDETRPEGSTVPGFLAVPNPTPLVLPAAEEAVPGEGSGGSATGEGKVAEPATLPPAPAGVADDPDGARTTPLQSVDKGTAAKSNDPQVQPPAEDDPRPAGPADEARPVLTGSAAEAVEARPRTGVSPPPAPAALPIPAPLRPLAERTSRPVDAPTAQVGDAPREGEPTRIAGAGAAAATAAATADPPNRPADLTVAATARDAMGDGEAEASTSEPAAPGEGAPTRSEAPVAAREPVLSTLSRATIEATAQIAAQIQRRLEGRSTRFEIALTPDELGRVDVKLDIDSEGRLNARLAFDNPVAATDLRGRADELRRQLEEAGFRLAEDAFEFADRDSGSSAFDRGQDARNGSSRAFAAASRLNAGLDVAQPPQWLSLSLSPSGVDMKV